jgi:hypothetical protein
MPYMTGGKRDYRKEYDKYHSESEQRKNRSTRNKARRKYEKENGDVSSSVDIDHKRPLSKGGGNGSSNLRAVSRSANRSYARTKTGKMK